MVKSKTNLNKSWLVVGLVALSFSVIGFAQNKTPDNWKCENRVGGSWVFGIAPAGCDAGVFGEDNYVWDTYIPVVYNEKKSSSSERGRYMNELAAVLKESATLYIRKRKPKVSTSEVAGFVRAIFAMAHQESYWSHYRKYSDLRLKMMRGDSGHGHGMMQVDDRWHFVAIKKGVGWNLVDNLIYAFEMYYSQWEKAIQAKCVPNANDYRARARAAYSAYNGGSSKICRWTNPSDKWAGNDKGFVDKYDKQSWISYIQDPGKRSQVNVDCLVDGQETCPLRSPSSSYETPVEGKIYQNSAKEVCVYRDGLFQCIAQMRDIACLQNSVGGTNGEINVLDAETEKMEQKKLLDRHELCFRNNDVGIYDMGNTIRLLKDINLRGTPAGNPIGVVPSGAIIQIFDFEVREQMKLKRYYQVYWSGKWGFIYAGDKTDYQSWTQATTLSTTNPLIAMVGQKIKVIHSGGINIRDSIGGNVIATAPIESILPVQQVIGKTDDNELYYQTKFQNKLGYIYSGRSLPEKTFNQWTTVIGK